MRGTSQKGSGTIYTVRLILWILYYHDFWGTFYDRLPALLPTVSQFRYWVICIVSPPLERILTKVRGLFLPFLANLARVLIRSCLLLGFYSVTFS